MHSSCGTKLSITESIYNGFYSYFEEGQRSSKPAFSAWWSCVFSLMMYLLALLFWVEAIIENFFGIDNFPFVAVLIVASALIAFVSEKGGEYTFFGASKSIMSVSQKRGAQVLALAYFLCGVILMIGSALLIYG